MPLSANNSHEATSKTNLSRMILSFDARGAVCRFTANLLEKWLFPDLVLSLKYSFFPESKPTIYSSPRVLERTIPNSIS